MMERESGKFAKNSINDYNNNLHSRNTSSINNNIFELLKDIGNYSTNQQLISYFNFAKFYGLLDPEKKSELEEAERNINRLNKINLFGVSSAIISGFYFYKRNYYNAAFFFFSFMGAPIFYFNYKINKETNFMLLNMKDDYFYQLERFFKEDKNPMVLNPNFLVEDIVDPDLKVYQNVCRLNLIK